MTEMAVLITWHGHTLCLSQLDKEMPMAPDPEADYWTAEDIADYLGVAVRTVYTYRLRGQKGEPGGLPQEDRMFGRSPVWRPATILGWQRPDSSTGRGRPPRRPTAEEA